MNSIINNSKLSPLITPPIVTPSDAEVDIEVLKTVPKEFAIDCEDHANWLVKKIVAARQYGDRIKEWAEQEQRRALREEETLFGRQIQQWTMNEIETLKGRRKSLNLPAGMVGFRSVAQSLQIDDETVVLHWAKENCSSAVVTVERLSRSELKAHFEKTGEIPDRGVHIDPGGERFYIR